MKNLIILIAITVSFGLLAGCNSNNSQSPPEITSVNPTVGTVGTPVTISGTGFSSNTAENSVSFNGTPTTVNTATESELQTAVPEGATSGVVLVTVNGQTAQGPLFSVDNRLNFEGDHENEDYEITAVQIASGTTTIDSTVTVTNTSEIEIRLVDGSTNEVELDVKDFLEDGLNFLLTALDSPTVSLNVDEDVIAEVSGNEFEFEDVDIIVSGNSFSVPGELNGEGILQNDGTILFSFEYDLVVSSNTDLTVSGEAELKKQ